VDVSIQNQIAARIERLIELPERVLCLLDAGIRLLAELSTDAFHHMRLKQGPPSGVFSRARLCVPFEFGNSLPEKKETKGHLQKNLWANRGYIHFVHSIE
jgi:hypothetical protein